MASFSLNRGFPSSVVDKVLNQDRPISRTSALTPSLPAHNSDRVPLILIYHPTSIHIQKLIRCHSVTSSEMPPPDTYSPPLPCPP
eukprot:g10654.t1